MQIIELELSHCNLYCPATGEVICNEETGMNENARSLMGYWVYEVYREPFIKNDKLEDAWEKLVSECEEAEERADEEDTELDEAFDLDTDRLVKFLKDYDAPNCIVYEITNCDFSCGPVVNTVWYVVNMNINKDDE